MKFEIKLIHLISCSKLHASETSFRLAEEFSDI